MLKSVRIVIAFFLSIFAIIASAESIPGGWVLSDDGILSKGTSYVRMFDKVEVNKLSLPEYVESIKESKPKPDDVVVTVESVENGKYVVQVVRVIERNGVQAHSVLLVCNVGQFKHHLLEIFVERKKVLDIIAAGKYAIGVCAS